MNWAFTASADPPVNAAEPVITYSPATLRVPGRPVPLEVRVSVPATGEDLPVILFSHGHGMSNFLSSLRGYGPLVDSWVAHGFVVLQPTHLDFTGLGLRDNGTEGARPCSCAPASRTCTSSSTTSTRSNGPFPGSPDA